MADLVRRLKLDKGSGATDVDIVLLEPRQHEGSWVCRYVIGWPEGVRAHDIWGADAVQSVYLAMQAVALDLYASAHHRSGQLYWHKPGEGYGFPMPKVARGELVGEDRESQL